MPVRQIPDENKPGRSSINISVHKSKPDTETQSTFQPLQRTLDPPFSYQEELPGGVAKQSDNLGSPIRFTHPAKPNLPAITERKPQDGVKYNPDQPASTNERRFISTDDLLARLPVQPIRRLTPIPGQRGAHQGIKEPSGKKLEMLKRGERRRPTPPSLRRAGSQLESPYASSEHVIFGGERYQTLDSRGKGKDALRKTDVFVSSY